MTGANFNLSQPSNEKATFCSNISIIEKVEMMFQKDPKDMQKKAMMINKFDNDYKKLRKLGHGILEQLVPAGVPQPTPMIGSRQAQQQQKSVIMVKEAMNTNQTLEFTDHSSMFKGGNTQNFLNTSKSNSNNFTFNFNNTRSSHLSSTAKGLKDIEWLKYAADREENLPQILKNQEMKSYLTNIPYLKDDSFQVPNLVKREQAKARQLLLQELSTMKKHSMSHFKSAQKLLTVTSDGGGHDKLGIPVFQKHQEKNNESRKLTKSGSLNMIAFPNSKMNKNGPSASQRNLTLKQIINQRNQSKESIGEGAQGSSALNDMVVSTSRLLPNISTRVSLLNSPMGNISEDKQKQK